MIVAPLEELIHYQDQIPHIEKALEAIKALPSLEKGKYEFPDGFFFIQEGELDIPEKVDFEAHRQYLDIHCPIEGQEIVLVSDCDSLTVSQAYDENDDYLLLKGQAQHVVNLGPGIACVVFPQDAHKPTRTLTRPSHFKKYVIKLPVA